MSSYDAFKELDGKSSAGTSSRSADRTSSTASKPRSGGS
jgi:hypothetical protein